METEKKCAIEVLMQKASAIYEAHARGAEMDAGFDAGEFSGPAHDEACEREINQLCQENGYTIEELQDAEAEATDEESQAPCFVSVMFYDRYFGGPEEGGWYYTQYERLESIFCSTNEEVSRWKANFEERYSNEGRREVSSVLSEGRYQIRVSKREQPLREPEVAPHYE